MRSGTCPKCRGTDVYAARNGLGLGEGALVGLRPHLEPGFRGMAVPHRTTDVWSNCCAVCGYVESYVIDPAALAFVRQSWPAVPVTPPPPPPPSAEAPAR